MAAPRKPKASPIRATPQAFDVVVERLPLNDEGWKALEQRVRARQPGLQPRFIAGFDRYGQPADKASARKGLRVSVRASTRATATAEARSRIETALKGWKDLQFYDPTAALASARITVLPRPKPATPPAGGGSPDHKSGTG